MPPAEKLSKIEAGLLRPEPFKGALQRKKASFIANLGIIRYQIPPCKPFYCPKAPVSGRLNPGSVYFSLNLFTRSVISRSSLASSSTALSAVTALSMFSNETFRTASRASSTFVVFLLCSFMTSFI